MIVADTIDEVRAWEGQVHTEGRTLALVPTMGALHAGHVALLRRAAEVADEVAVSIYINPTQFAPGEDIERYPRPLERDLEMCRAEGVALAFTPSDAQMYPEGFATQIDLPALGERIEGESRLGHFRGVCTVVLKLLNIVRPSAAVFGWKDAQQFLILQRMVEDLNLTVRMEAVETVRESDGLACSSRNVYLTDEERGAAPAIHGALQAGLARVIAGARRAALVREAIVETLAEEPLVRLDRLDFVSRDTLEPLERIAPGNTLIAIAAHLGRARLIDNVRC